MSSAHCLFLWLGDISEPKRHLVSHCAAVNQAVPNIPFRACGTQTSFSLLDKPIVVSLVTSRSALMFEELPHCHLASHQH